MMFIIFKCVLIVAVIGFIASSNATDAWPPIRKSEIQPGTLVFFFRDRIQKSVDLDWRARELDAQLARIMDPPFDSERKRVNIEKVFNSTVRVGVKPRHLTLAKSMFDDESALAPSPNQKLELEIFKIPSRQPIGETIIKQIILANQLQHCYGAFLLYRQQTMNRVKNLLQKTQRCRSMLYLDPEEQVVHFKGTALKLLHFLDNITSPSHLDNNTLDDFRELVAQCAFWYHIHSDANFFEDNVRFAELAVKERNPKSFKILRIFSRNLQRDQPTLCPKLEVMREDFVNYQMVYDLLYFVWSRCTAYYHISTIKHLSNLYKLMDSDAKSTMAMWEWGLSGQGQAWQLVNIAEFISRKIGLRTPWQSESTNEEVLQIMRQITVDMNRGWLIHFRARVFSVYWDKLYRLKREGFSGRIAIVNRDYILDESWIQSLCGIFGRDNTVIERVTEL